MSSDGSSVITVEEVSKSFLVDDPTQPSRWRGLRRAGQTRVQAVGDVSFDVARGELVGLVGANGAGKSTLLKLISRVMEPDRGRLRLGGPVMSLIEVGAGFHPELTGAENVYLNGAILGLDSRRVRRCFDDIVALAGVERFVDTPVKRFSSGMRVRLAVAIGLHLDSDAVVLDEVLSVGDAVFQRRCLEILDEMASTGARATILVSHNMQTIQQLCRRVLVMQRGRLVFDGDPQEAIAKYFAQLGTGAAGGGTALQARTNVHGDGRILLTGARLVDQHGAPLVPVVGGPLGVEVDVDLTGVESELRLDLRISSRDGRLIATAEQALEASPAETAMVSRRWWVPTMPLAAGQYSLGLSLSSSDGSTLDAADQVMTFTVQDPSRAPGSFAAGLGVPHVVLGGEWEPVEPPSRRRTIQP